MGMGMGMVRRRMGRRSNGSGLGTWNSEPGIRDQG